MQDEQSLTRRKTAGADSSTPQGGSCTTKNSGQQIRRNEARIPPPIADNSTLLGTIITALILLTIVTSYIYFNLKQAGGIPVFGHTRK
jgi:hypothetical protein